MRSNTISKRYSELMKNFNIWNGGFVVLIFLIVGLAVLDSLNPEASITIIVGRINMVVPGDYFYQFIFNPLWVLAAFFYERNVHSKLGSTVLTLGKVQAITLDAAVNNKDKVSIVTINNILADTNQRPEEVEELIKTNQTKADIDGIDSIDENLETPPNLSI